MTDRQKEADSGEAQAYEVHQGHLLPQLGMMFRALLAARVRNTLFALGGAVFVVVAATAYGQLRLNRWNQPFYDSLAHRDLRRFLEQLGVFAVIAGVLLVLNVAQKWLGEMLKLKLRQGLVHDLLQNWLAPGRAFRLAHAGPIGENPDQRMHEDTRHLTELSADLGIALLQASILLVIFVRVLWSVSSQFSFRIGAAEHAIPGYMVWAALFYAGSASLLSYWVGRSLIPRNARRYQRESELRFSLVRVNEHIDAITLAGGEAGEAQQLELDLNAVLRAMRALVTGLTNLTWITAGYGWFTIVAPLVAAAPLYFAGNLSFGGLMMAAGAFNQVQSSLRWFVDNFSTLADWRATLLRVANFRTAIVSTDELHPAESRIHFEEGAPGKIQIEDLQIASPSGCTMLEEKRAEVRAGDHVLVVAAAGTGKTLLFRALAGLWPWGTGRIVRSRTEETLYLSRSPYMPPGTLREVLAYPSETAHFDDAAFTRALTRLGLERLLPQLDAQVQWSSRLSDEEQQSLALARIVLREPAWVFIDDLLGSLDADARKRILHVLTHDLSRTGVIHIGRPAEHDPFFSHTLHLVKDPQSRRLNRGRRAPVQPEPQRPTVDA